MSRHPDAKMPRDAAGRRRRRGTRAMLVLTAAVLAACQSIEPVSNSPVQWRVEPLQRVTSGGETAEGYYALGRYLQGQKRFEQALAAYRRAVEIDPRHAEAHNALGVMRGLQGRIDDSIAQFQAALELQPSAPHILGNLGYALTLDGRYAEAIVQLQRALRLDPANASNRKNLALAIGLGERTAGPIVPIASPLHALRDAVAPHVVTVEERSGTAAPEALSMGPSAPSEPVTTTATAAATADANRSDVARAPIAGPLTAYRLEIANGMGVTGAAARIGERLARAGAPVARLKNQRPFNETATVIYFASGFEDEAQRLAADFGGMKVRIQPARLAASDVRVVIGRDVLPLVVAGVPASPAAKGLHATRSG